MFQFAALPIAKVGMASFIKPMLIGAGVGALGGLLTGRDPLTGAAIGGATGAGAGLLGGGAAGSMNLKGATVSNAGYTAGANPSAFLAPNVGQEIGMANAFNMATNAPTDLAMQSFGANNAMLSNPIMGGVNPLSEADYSQIESSTATDGSSLFDELKPYFDVRDLTGAGLTAAMNQQRPQMPTAPAGGIQRGQAPQGTDVMALLQTIKQPEKRRISLV